MLDAGVADYKTGESEVAPSTFASKDRHLPARDVPSFGRLQPFLDWADDSVSRTTSVEALGLVHSIGSDERRPIRFQQPRRKRDADGSSRDFENGQQKSQNNSTTNRSEFPRLIKSPNLYSRRVTQDCENTRHVIRVAGEAPSDRDILELNLAMVSLSLKPKDIVGRLLSRFGSYTNVICASIYDLASVDGMDEASIAALKIVQIAAQRLSRAELMRQPVLGNWDALLDYLHTVMARDKIEQFRILFLDSKNRLIADEALTRGTVNHVPVYPREVIRRALELHAVALILSHNHPSGDPTPSRGDIEMTIQIVDAAKALSIAVHDHVIVGNGTWLSFRKEGLI